MSELDIYFSGQKLYGDDFGPAEIAQWHTDEEEAYADLGARDRASYTYVYHALNEVYGFDRLPGQRFRNALGVGSAYGDEFAPIAEHLETLTILEPSSAFESTEVHGTPCSYVKPAADGSMPFEDSQFDLVTCLGVLHHIPNVSSVMREIHRCLEPGGTALIREPIISMGDWRQPRPGLTKRERGIPLTLFMGLIRDTGFEIRHRALCGFPLNLRICGTLGVAIYNSPVLTRFDALCGAALAWNYRYHGGGALQKFRPTIAQFLLTKRQ